MFPSSVQEEEAHLRAALRASAAEASPSSARGSGVSERGARRDRQPPRSVRDIGTAFYPTRATVPGGSRARGAYGAGPRGARPSASSEPRSPVARGESLAFAAQLDEALRRSKEEADLAEALRRSALETRTRRKDADKMTPIRGIRRGYAASPPGDARSHFEDEARDVAAAAFLSVAFGATRRAESERDGTGARGTRETTRDDGDSEDDDERARDDTLVALERSAAESRAREALEREALERLWAEAAAAAERERERERVAAAAADAAAREARREARREAEREARDAARRERKRAAEAEAEAEKAETARRAAESETASAAVARTLGRLDLPRALAAVGFAPSDAASAAAVRRAYRRAALRFHPDRTRGLSVAERARGEEVWKALGSKMEAFERTAA